MRFLLLLYLVFVACSLRAQERELIAENVAFVALDRVGQLYLQYKDGRLEKRDAASKQTYVFHDRLLGEITSMDLNDPFGALLYFEEYQTVLLLDRTLNEYARLDLRTNENILQPILFARRFDDQLWVFDDWDKRLKLIDQQGRVIRQSDQLGQLLGKQTPPLSLKVENNLLFVLWPDGELVTFTFYGRLSERQQLPEAVHYLWTNKGLIAWNDTQCWVWNGKETTEKQIDPALLTAVQMLDWQTGMLVLEKNNLFYLK